MRIDDPKFFFHQTMSAGEIYSFLSGEVGIYSNRSPEKDTRNEDAAAFLPFDIDSGALVVADGVGGYPEGERASCAAVTAMVEAILSGARTGGHLRQGILDGFEKANQVVQALGLGAATTLAVVEIQGRNIRPYHVGDSTIMVVGQKGKLKLQTIAHSPVGYGVEAGLIDEREAIHHEDRHLVSNLVGSDAMRIEIGPTMRLAAKDTLLLGSDALFDNLLLDEIIERIRKGKFEALMHNLVQLCRARMNHERDGSPSKPDDLTFIAFRSVQPRNNAPAPAQLLMEFQTLP